MKLHRDIVLKQTVSTVLPTIIDCLKNPVAIVRCIDSSFSKEDLIKILEFHQITYEFMAGNIVLFAENLQKTILQNVFTGFDEIWLYENSPTSMNLMDVPSCTSDCANFSKKIDDTVLEVFLDSKSVVILADGCGLNYLTRNYNIFDKLDF